MSESKFETISSLMDNYHASTDEAVAEQAIDDIVKDEQLSTTWQNYHLIGDVMRDEMAEELQLDLSAQISEAIAKEATILSPNNSSLAAEQNQEAMPVLDTENAQQAPKVISAENRFKARVAKLIKPLGQVAIAASAAGLMIVGVQHNTASNQLENPVVPSQVLQTMPLTGYANPVSFNYQADNQVDRKSKQLADKQKAEQRIAQQRRFHALLVDHQQQIKLTASDKSAQALEKK